MSTWVLIAIIAMGNTSNTQLPVTSLAVEFTSAKACEAAKENIRHKLSAKAQVVLLTCEAK